jgi:ArsR family transcriptional regulator
MELSEAVTGLAALAQESRLAIFRLLVEAGGGGLCAGEIGAELDLPSPTLSFHLKVLKQAGLVAARRDGRTISYSADYEAIRALTGYLTENCCRRTGGKRRG